MATQIPSQPGKRRPSLAILAGIVGPVVLGIAIPSLTILEYDFMRSLRWHPLNAPTTDWPSGLALGPYGAWMTATFLSCGALMAIFATGLVRLLPANRPARIGGQLLTIAGVAMMALSSPTDPTYGPGPATIYGRIHDLSYIVLAISLCPAILCLAWAFLRDPRWVRYGYFTVLVLLMAVPGLTIKGALFYGFLVAMIVWFEALALRAWQLESV